MSSLTSSPPAHRPLGANTLLKKAPPALLNNPDASGHGVTPHLQEGGPGMPQGSDLAGRMPNIPVRPVQPRPMHAGQTYATQQGFSLTSHSLSRAAKDVFTPYNTPADAPPIMGNNMARSPIVPRGINGHLGGLAGKIQGKQGSAGHAAGGANGTAGRPIGGLAAVRGGLGMGGGIAPHAITPGNTPSSLENISRRMARNLSVDAGGHAMPESRIAPSYERRFRADLGDLEKRLQGHMKHPSSLRHSGAPISPPRSTQHSADMTPASIKETTPPALPRA